ncbi:response regulator [Kistimonas scapharcae]|uniref:Response regulator n=1 Tax=Kistimonas scapharcae TaxID=1036133 RepID=A0ABP8V945_9GAMM
MTKILLVDDDIELCELLVELLGTEGFNVTAVHDGAAGVEAALTGEYELVLLDVTLPKLNGFEVLRTIRQQSQTPVLMLTARGDDVDRIVGLEIGADDYLPKPYKHRELVARMKAILRRTQIEPEKTTSRKKQLEIDDLMLNLANHEVYVSGDLLDVTATEFIVLKTLIEKAGELVTRDELTQTALSRRLEPFDRAIDMHVSNLRRKIGNKPDGRPRLKTVRGSGYFYIGE